MIDWFESSESETNEVPWLREYIEAGGDYDTPIDVDACFIGLKGILVVTERYKAFVFKGSKLYKDLIEALPEYESTTTGTAVLVACGTDGGKILLGIDQERIDARWKKDKNAYIQHVLTASEFNESRMRPRKNPLLADAPIPSRRKTRKQADPDIPA